MQKNEENLQKYIKRLKQLKDSDKLDEDLRDVMESYLRLERILIKVARNPDMKDCLGQVIGEIKDAIRPEVTCDLCGKKYRSYMVPSEYWNKLPEHLRDKQLCFACYFERVKRRQP